MRKSLFLVGLLLFSLARPGVGSCGPLLNEILAAPARDWDGDGSYNSKNDEWVEIVNPGSSALDLTGYYLGDQAGKCVYGFSGSLAAGAVQVVYGSQSVAWESAHGQSTVGLGLANSGDTVELLQMVGKDTLLVDAYTYNANEGGSDRSTGRVPDGGPDWQIFDALDVYHGTTPPLGNGLAPTPGALNDPAVTQPTQVATDTWGRVKSLYGRP